MDLRSKIISIFFSPYFDEDDSREIAMLETIMDTVKNINSDIDDKTEVKKHFAPFVIIQYPNKLKATYSGKIINEQKIIEKTIEFDHYGFMVNNCTVKFYMTYIKEKDLLLISKIRYIFNNIHREEYKN